MSATRTSSIVGNRGSSDAVLRARSRSLAIDLQIAAGAAQAPTVGKVRRWARAALGRPGEVTVRVVGTAEARLLNRRYSGHDYATNVLSFPYTLSARRVHGDIVLCAPVIAREARAQGKSVEAHFAHLTVHGLLHLQGHDHSGSRDAARMEALEKRILGKLGYPDPYAS
jgi:probable rRNA maturation factor